MRLNQEASVSIQARPRWNDTGIDLYKGQSCLLKASGEWCDWQYRASQCGYQEP
jgi:phage-related protein